MANKADTKEQLKDSTPVEAPKETKVETPVVDPIQAKLAELDEEIRKAREANNRWAEKEKELEEKMSALKPLAEANPQVKALIASQHEDDAKKMKKHLSKQDRVKIFVPLEGKEPKGSLLPVILNGYRVNVPKGVYVAVPEQVAEVIMESLNQTEQATNIPQNMENMDQAAKLNLE